MPACTPPAACTDRRTRVSAVHAVAGKAAHVMPCPATSPSLRRSNPAWPVDAGVQRCVQLGDNVTRARVRLHVDPCPCHAVRLAGRDRRSCQPNRTAAYPIGPSLPRWRGDAEQSQTGRTRLQRLLHRICILSGVIRKLAGLLRSRLRGETEVMRPHARLPRLRWHARTHRR